MSASVAVSSISRPLVVYRNLLRAQKIAFAGDHVVMEAAKAKTRNEFEKFRGLTDPAKIEEQIKIGEDVTKLLTTNLLQTKMRESGVQEAMLDPKRHEINTSPKGREPPPSQRGAKRPAKTEAPTTCCGGNCH